MAYTDDAVKAKLSALNETQEGIVSCSQWIMFHRRHADRTAQLWMQRLKDSTPSKRLNLVYLANEVVQQSKARKKNEFVDAFTPIIAEATSIAYKGVPNDIQQKLRRTIEVWRQRQIFDLKTQDAIEQRIDELDRHRNTAKKATLGGSLFSASPTVAPPELQPLIPLQTALTKAALAQPPALARASAEHATVTDPAAVPTPPVHAARLSALLKTLASAEGAVAETLRARRALLAALAQQLDAHRAALAEDEAHAATLRERQAAVEATRRDVEDGIMRGLAAAPADIDGGDGGEGAGGEEPPRPEFEALTPPPVESLTPAGSPPDAAAAHKSTTGADVGFFTEMPVSHDEPPPALDQLLLVVDQHNGAVDAAGHAGAARAAPLVHPREGEEEEEEEEEEEDGSGAAGVWGERVKRRRVGSGGVKEFGEFMGEGMDGIDEDVAAMLGGE